MSAIRSALDELAAEPNDRFSVDELVADVDELVHVSQMVDVLIAEKVRSLTDRGGHIALGYPNPTALLTHIGRMSGGRARQIVARSNAAEKAPAAFRAWADGRLSTDQARHVFSLAETVPNSFSEAEDRLVDIVEGLSVRDTRKALEYWRQSVDGPGELDADVAFARRGLSSSKTIGGMRHVEGWLTQRPEKPSTPSSTLPWGHQPKETTAAPDNAVTTPWKTSAATG